MDVIISIVEVLIEYGEVFVIYYNYVDSLELVKVNFEDVYIGEYDFFIDYVI